jgi:hypothetical protein
MQAVLISTKILLTAGSSKPDLVLSALPDCDDFYAQLLGQYGGN